MLKLQQARDAHTPAEPVHPQRATMQMEQALLRHKDPFTDVAHQQQQQAEQRRLTQEMSEGQTRVRVLSDAQRQGIASVVGGRDLSGVANRFDSQNHTILSPSTISTRRTQSAVDSVIGSDREITIIRVNEKMSFGFALASLWTIDGRRNVISWVDEKGPSFRLLQVEDEVIGIGRENVQNISLDDMKSRVRRLGTEFKLKIHRRPTAVHIATTPGIFLRI